jgi:membrane-associated protease RseP (regulator of RpoE activity)
MPRKILLIGLAMLLLAGSAFAADLQQLVPPQAPDQSPQAPLDVLYLQVVPDQQSLPQFEGEIPAPFEGQVRNLPGVIGDGRSGQWLIGDPIPVQLQRVMQNRAPGEYWLGIECYLVLPVLRVHLGLPENQGLVAGSVIPDSPAAKAGIEANDILLQAGEKRLATVKDLSETVEAAKETPLKLQIIHAGKPKSIEITPAKRPQNDVLFNFNRQGTPDEWKEIEAWMQKMHSGANAEQPQQLHFRFIQPGAILPPGAPIQPPMPGNMSININRNGTQPAHITITWNDKNWNITEEELDKLPAEVRPYVERMLGREKVKITGPDRTISAEALDITIPAPSPGMPGAQGMQRQVQISRSLEERLEELNRKLDQLQKELHEQWGQHPPSAQSEKNIPPTEPEQPAESPK